jgi:hypothetical protein
MGRPGELAFPDFDESGSSFRAAHHRFHLQDGNGVSGLRHGNEGRALDDALPPDDMNLNRELIKEGENRRHRKYGLRNRIQEGVEKSEGGAKVTSRLISSRCPIGYGGKH